MKIRSFLLLFIIPYFGFSQLSDTSKIHFSPDVTTLREHIYAGISDELKQGSWERRTYRFADISANQICSLINSGTIYTDWPELENYLNEIMQKVLPPDLKGDTMIHAYILADGAYNAFMTPTGMMFINIGLLTEIEDEATLAAVLAHELAHYRERHSLNGFVKSERGDFSSIFFRNNEASRFSIENEYEADSLAILWLKNSGYSLSGILKSFEAMRQRERNTLSLQEKKWEMEESSHPLPGKRQAKFEKFRADNPDEGNGKAFLVNKALFTELKEKAKLEVLKNLLANFNYTFCVEKAFKFHLLDPNNRDYVYYLLEAIRRKCYLNISMWQENFITYRYHISREVGGLKVKDKMEDHLFVNFNPDILMISKKEQKDIKAMFYWEEEPKFFTYEQAFIFYYRVGRALGNNEVILSNALSITHDKDIRNQMLKEYLSKKNIAHREYAESLLKGTTLEELKDSKLTVMNHFDVYIRQGDENIELVPRDSDRSLLRLIIDSVFKEYPYRRLIYMEDLRKNKLGEYRNLFNMETFSAIHILSKGNKIELHILEPRFWNTFQRYGVNEIEFVNCLYLEARKSESSKEAYDSAIQTKYKELFEEVKRTRDFVISIRSLREMENSRMKIPYASEDNLRFKDPGLEQIVKLLHRNIKEKEEYALKADNNYRYYHGN